MSKGRALIALFAIFAVVVGTYVFLSNRQPELPEQVVTERIRLLELNIEDIASMTLVSEDETLTILREGENWRVDYPYPLTLNIGNIEDIAYSFIGLSAEQVVAETAEDLSSFGLDNPAVEATISLQDGSEYTVYLGNRTPVGNMFYLMKSGDERIFTVWGSHGTHFSYTLADLRDTSLPIINLETVSYFKLLRADERPIEIVQTEEASEQQLQLGFARWHMIQPYNEYASVHYERFNTLLANLTEFGISRFINDNPTDLSEYGLDSPAMELLVQDGEQTLHLLFGAMFEEEYVYFQLAGQDAVYAMESAMIEPFLATTPFEIIDRFAFIVMIDHVDEILIETQNREYTLSLTRTVDETDEEAEPVVTFDVNGLPVDDEEFRDFYQALIGLIVEAEYLGVVEGTPYVTTTFRFNQEDMPDVSISYVPFNEDFFAVVRGEVTEFLVSRVQVNRMLEVLSTLGQE